VRILKKSKSLGVFWGFMVVYAKTPVDAQRDFE
jgi:hypothetical protein